MVAEILNGVTIHKRYMENGPEAIGTASLPNQKVLFIVYSTEGGVTNRIPITRLAVTREEYSSGYWVRDMNYSRV